MKVWDCIIVGGGVIGLSTALELRRAGADVVVIDRTEPGREASWAAGGMIADLDPSLPTVLKPFATASAKLYPEFIRRVEEESGKKVDFRTNGTIAFVEHPVAENESVRALSVDAAKELEPFLEPPRDPAYFMQESAVDPRDLVAALLQACRDREVEIATGSPAVEVTADHHRATGVRTERAAYLGKVVINCAGAWAPQIKPLAIPTRPVKGHMVSLIFPEQRPTPALTHVVRGRWCYILPRSTGKYVVGSTVEPAGFDKSVNTYRVQKLHQAAANLVPVLGEARMNEAWTGLRPGTPDNLPIIGETSIANYFAATGHYRDGMLLAPATAVAMAQMVSGGACGYDLKAFSPARFNL